MKDPATGALRGIGLDLAAVLGQQLGVPVKTVSYPYFGGAISASQTGAWDVGILPVNPQATAVASLTAPFLLVPHSYLVRADSSIRTVADADQPGVRIASETGRLTRQCSPASWRTRRCSRSTARTRRSSS